MSVHIVSSAMVNMLVGQTLVTHDAALADPAVLAKAITDAGLKADTFDRKRAGSLPAPTNSQPTELGVEFETNTKALNTSKMFRTSEEVMSAETNAN